jgi:RNA polymerase II subunit A-like phosphatase
MIANFLHADDFFIGIGDINSTFLPKVQSLTPQISENKESAPRSSDNGSPTGSSSPSNVGDSTLVDSPSLPKSSPTSSAELSTTAMLTQNNLALEAQLEERPLAKKQEELQEASTENSEHTLAAVEKSDLDDKTANTETTKADKPVRKALLKNDDTELDRISKVNSQLMVLIFTEVPLLLRQLLEDVHSRFYTAYNASLQNEKANQRKPGRSNSQDRDIRPSDVTVSFLSLW